MKNESLFSTLSALFGEETTRQACLIDVADLCMNDEMLESITAGVKKLKELRNDPDAQVKYIKSLEMGASLVLCMWIMDMNLADKIKAPSSQSINR